MLELAHDVRQPLAVLRTLVETLRRDPALGARQHAALDAIDDQLALLSDFTRAALDRDGERQDSVPLDRVLTSATTAFGTLHGCSFHLSLDQVTVVGSAGPLWHIFANIIDNACRAAGPEGEVHVTSASHVPGLMSIDVADDGPGFGAVAGGTGIGLVVAVREVHGLGGSVEFHGRPGPGTLVRVLLPVGDQLRPEDACHTGSPH